MTGGLRNDIWVKHISVINIDSKREGIAIYSFCQIATVTDMLAADWQSQTCEKLFQFFTRGEASQLCNKQVLFILK